MEKKIYIFYTFSLCVCSFSCTARKAYAPIYVIFSSVACLAASYFSTLSCKLHDVREKVIERKMCILIFPTTLSETLLIQGRSQRDIVICVHRSYVKYPLFLSDFINNLEFSPQIFEKYSSVKFHENPSKWAELFHEARQTDTHDGA